MAMANPVTPKRPNLLLVTFDLNQPRPGDIRYRRVDSMLAASGATLRPFKQTRFVVTRSSPRAITAGIRAIIGRRGNVGVMRVSRRSAVEIADPGIRTAVLAALGGAGSP